MALTDRFQLSTLKRDDGARTFEAREISTGRPVLVHLFTDQGVFVKLNALPADERGRVIDQGTHEGGYYLVTDRLAEYNGFSEWLAGKNSAGPKSLETAGAWSVPPPAKKPSVDDQLARLFDTVQPPIPTQVTGLVPPPAPVLTNTAEHTLKIPPESPTSTIRIPVLPVAPPPVMRPAPTPPQTPIPTPNGPGEFTRMFSAPAPGPPSPPPVVEKPTPTKPPGEFTKMIQRPVQALPRVPPPLSMQPPSAPPAAPQPAPAPPVGEFTQMLQAQRPSAPPAPAEKHTVSEEFAIYFQSPMTPPPAAGGSPVMAPPPPMPAQPPKGAGEFTQIFGRGDMPSAPPSPAPVAPPPQMPGNATNVFVARPTPPPPLSMMAAPPLMPPPQLPMTPATPVRNAIPQAPGEYTRMFAAPSPMTLGQPQAAPSPHLRMPESRPPRNTSRLPILLMLGGAFLLIVAIVIYFVLRPHAV